ncbi:hypothetical protein [Paludibaculum fermentans]|uniref:Uncharacterized protein n=1 Tax=Paludibaculum fermentans TaxID=1473598 RepID=A0A7S7NMK7_PALFE|nr:hypothetical protein [Paludibaculum fermentans]QOY86344.1 hypothetical protein IRI77_26535 [Paludibaculum fermentans]
MKSKLSRVFAGDRRVEEAAFGLLGQQVENDADLEAGAQVSDGAVEPAGDDQTHLRVRLGDAVANGLQELLGCVIREDQQSGPEVFIQIGRLGGHREREALASIGRAHDHLGVVGGFRRIVDGDHAPARDGLAEDEKPVCEVDPRVVALQAEIADAVAGIGIQGHFADGCAERGRGFGEDPRNQGE